nr:immunoglobulin light chain junction region [Macaca mulatta]
DYYCCSYTASGSFVF